MGIRAERRREDLLAWDEPNFLSRGIDSSPETRHSRGMVRMLKDGACDSFQRQKEDANKR